MNNKGQNASLGKQVNDHQILQTKFNVFQNTFDGLNNGKLSYQASQLKEISPVKYYIGLQYYKQVCDMLIDNENQLIGFKLIYQNINYKTSKHQL